MDAETEALKRCKVSSQSVSQSVTDDGQDGRESE